MKALRLETRPLTAAYWGAVLLHGVALFVPRFPPLVDYPQHLAIASILHRWMVPGSPERAVYDANFFTYNGAFHTLAALLGFVVPMETAGKLVVALVPILFGAGGLALVRAARRPPSYAFAIVPLSLSAMVTWGFLNNALAYGVTMLGVAFHVRAMRGERRALLWAAALGPVVAYLHIFGAFVLSAVVGLLALRRLFLRAGPWGPRIACFLRTSAALVPAAALSAAFVLHNRSSSYSNWENAAHDGWDEFAWRKLAWAADFVFGNFVDGSDRRLAYALFGALAFLYFPRPRAGAWRRAPRLLRDFRFLAIAFAFAYFVTPRVLFATWFIFERIPVVVIALCVCGAPALGRRGMTVARAALAGLALAAGANAVAHHARIPDEADADAVLDAVPEGARLLGLVWEPSPWPVLVRQTYVHLQAFHLARRRGDVMVSFAVIESLPIHYKPGAAPPRRDVGAEWRPETYDVDAPYAQHFDTVLVRAPWDVSDPAELVFKDAAPRARLLARRGRFFLYDARAAVAAPAQTEARPPGSTSPGIDTADGVDAVGVDARARAAAPPP